MRNKLVAVLLVVLIVIALGFLLAGSGNTGCSSAYFCLPDANLVLLGILLATIIFLGGVLARATGRGRKLELPPND